MCLAVRVRSSAVLILYGGSRAEGFKVCEEYGAGATHYLPGQGVGFPL